jgi:hypothetical protein
MNCDCFKKVEESLKERMNDPFAQLIRGCVLVGAVMTAVPFVPVEYRDVKKDGTLEDEATRHGLVASFCPFCGVKAFEGKEAGE